MKVKEFRMSFVNRIKDLNPKDRAKVIDEILQGRYVIPFSNRETLSKTTLYRWLREFRESADAGTALSGEIRKDRGSFPSLTEEQKAALLRWRYDNAYRTAEDLREELLNHENTCNPPPPSTSTIARFLRSEGLSRDNILFGIKPQAKIRLAFEAEYPQQIWMADTKGPDVYVLDPKDPSRHVKAMPICIEDDNSRYAVSVRYVVEENESAVMALFCQAVLLYGIPEIFYVDRGPAYSGKSLKKAASLIGCNVILCARRSPESKGKQEKLLRTIHERFEHEMKAAGKANATLEEYNQYLTAYIARDYNRKVHNSTGQTPEERFFAYPAKFRRFVTQDSLLMIFLPCRSASVSKTGLVRVCNGKYLVQDAMLWGKKIQVRYDEQDLSRVYLWYEEKYYGEAHLFIEENDFIQREILTESVRQAPKVPIPMPDQVPVYSRLERQLARYREEMEVFDVNGQLLHNRQKKHEVRSTILSGRSVNINEPKIQSGDFGIDAFLYLMMKLLRRKFTPSERLTAHALWKSVGPIDEDLVRKVTGRLLGEEHPTSDLKGYLEEIRQCILTKNNTN